MGVFDTIDFGGMQMILYPVIEALGGPDLRAEVADKSSLLAEGGDVLKAAADLLYLASEATSDGILSNEELDAIVGAAPGIFEAAQDVFAAIRGKGEVSE